MLGIDFHNKSLINHKNIFSFKIFWNAEHDHHDVQPRQRRQR